MHYQLATRICATRRGIWYRGRRGMCFRLEGAAARAYDLKMGNMRRPVVITSPFASPEETARIYRIPKRRANELRKLVEDSLAKKGYILSNDKDSNGRRNGAGSKTLRFRHLGAKPQAAARVKSKSGNASRRKTTRAKTKTTR
jgi:hypothetical protein